MEPNVTEVKAPAAEEPKPVHLRMAKEVTDPAERRAIWLDHTSNGGTLSYSQIETKYGLKDTNGMTAYRICRNYEKENGLAKAPVIRVRKQEAPPVPPVAETPKVFAPLPVQVMGTMGDMLAAAELAKNADLVEIAPAEAVAELAQAK